MSEKELKQWKELKKDLQEMKEKWDALHKKYCVEEQEELRCNN